MQRHPLKSLHLHCVALRRRMLRLPNAGANSSMVFRIAQQQLIMNSSETFPKDSMSVNVFKQSAGTDLPQGSATGPANKLQSGWSADSHFSPNALQIPHCRTTPSLRMHPQGGRMPTFADTPRETCVCRRDVQLRKSDP